MRPAIRFIKDATHIADDLCSLARSIVFSLLDSDWSHYLGTLLSHFSEMELEGRAPKLRLFHRQAIEVSMLAGGLRQTIGSLQNGMTTGRYVGRC